jgi:NitT/TauT family transport system substrate-binding protein
MEEVMLNKCLRPILAGLFLATVVTAAAAQDKVILSLQWIPAANHFGIFAAKEEGFYRDAGLDVEVQRGYGSGESAKRVATGTADFGIADAAAVIVGRNNGLKVKQVASLYEKSPNAIFYIKGTGINTLKDMEGRSIGATAGEASLNLLPILATNAGFDAKKITIMNVTPSAKYASLVAKTVDSIVAFTNEAPTIENAAEKTGQKIGQFVFSDYGVDYYSLGFIASDRTIADRPDVVRRFLLATMKGYAWSIKNTTKAADDYMKNFPESSREITLQQWDAALPLILSDNVKKNGFGFLEKGKMAETLRLIVTSQKIDSSMEVTDIFDTRFVPDVKLTD